MKITQDTTLKEILNHIEHCVDDVQIYLCKDYSIKIVNEVGDYELTNTGKIYANKFGLKTGTEYFEI